MRRKLAFARWTPLIVVVGYGAIYVAVSASTSPADQALPMPGGETLAHLTWRGADSPPRRVVLAHGAPADAGSFNRLREALDDRSDRGEPWPASEWIVVDRPGYGNTSAPEDETLAGHAAAMAPALESIEGAGPILVGHSYGGPVALRAAVDYPDRVGAIVLLAGATDPYMNDSQWFRRAVDAVDFAVPKSWAVANRELLALTEENRAMEPLLGRVRCPVVVVHGTWDPVCPYDGTIDYLRSRLTNAAAFEVVTLERAGHNVHLSHPEVVLDAIERAVELASEQPSRTAD